MLSGLNTKQPSPPPSQVPVLPQAAASMLKSGVLRRTKRGPYLSPIQLAPKSATESRFILNASALTPHMKAPKFRLQPLPVAVLENHLPRKAFFTKKNLAEAYCHFSLSPATQRLTTFKLDHQYLAFKTPLRSETWTVCHAAIRDCSDAPPSCVRHLGIEPPR